MQRQEPQNAPLAVHPVPEVDVGRLAELHDSGVRIIDVRQPDEYATAHVPDAQLIPLNAVPDRCDEVSGSGTVYVICATGARSHRAAEYYRTRGIDAVNVAGGTVAWIDAGFAVDDGLESPARE
jgi:rhodanese-related sulfurtransferase